MGWGWVPLVTTWEFSAWALLNQHFLPWGWRSAEERTFLTDFLLELIGNVGAGVKGPQALGAAGLVSHAGHVLHTQLPLPKSAFLGFWLHCFLLFFMLAEHQMGWLWEGGRQASSELGSPDDWLAGYLGAESVCLKPVPPSLERSPLASFRGWLVVRVQ